jgi:hypothetical protein
VVSKDSFDLSPYKLCIFSLKYPACTKASSDRICGICYGGNALLPSDGAYGEHIVAKSDLQIKIPPNLSFEGAATLGVGITTIGVAMYQVLQLPLPPQTAKESFPILNIRRLNSYGMPSNSICQVQWLPGLDDMLTA